MLTLSRNRSSSVAWTVLVAGFAVAMHAGVFVAHPLQCEIDRLVGSAKTG